MYCVDCVRWCVSYGNWTTLEYNIDASIHRTSFGPYKLREFPRRNNKTGGGGGGYWCEIRETPESVDSYDRYFCCWIGQRKGLLRRWRSVLTSSTSEHKWEMKVYVHLPESIGTSKLSLILHFPIPLFYLSLVYLRQHTMPESKNADNHIHLKQLEHFHFSLK